MDSKIPDVYPSERSTDKPFEGSKTKELFKAVASSSLENAALAIEGFSGGIIGGIAGIATGLVNTGSAAQENLVRRKQRNDKINQINNLKLTTGNYVNHKGLQELERQERINTKALEECVQPDNIKKFEGLNAEEIQHIFEQDKKEVADRREFEAPAEKSRYQKVKSAVKAGKDYFVESQFGDLKETYHKAKEEINTPSATPAVNKPSSPNIYPEQQKLQDKVKHMMKNFKSSSYPPHSSHPPSTPNAKKPEQNKGHSH